MKDRKYSFVQLGKPSDLWGIFAFSLQLQEVSINADVDLPKDNLCTITALLAWLIVLSLLKTSPAQRNSYLFENRGLSP